MDEIFPEDDLQANLGTAPSTQKLLRDIHTGAGGSFRPFIRKLEVSFRSSWLIKSRPTAEYAICLLTAVILAANRYDTELCDLSLELLARVTKATGLWSAALALLKLATESYAGGQADFAQVCRLSVHMISHCLVHTKGDARLTLALTLARVGLFDVLDVVIPQFALDKEMQSE